MTRSPPTPWARALFPHLFPEGAKPLNSCRYLFLDPRAQSFYPDWETVARDGVSGLRLLAGQDPSDRALMALVGELATRSEEFRTWWGGHTVRTHTSGTKRINHPVVGDLTLGYETLALASTPGRQHGHLPARARLPIGRCPGHAAQLDRPATPVSRNV